MADTDQEKLDDIRKRPDRHRHHEMNELVRCCMIDGAIDGMLLQEHAGTGHNHGQKCDVISGPCGCGGWH
jgi:hypothetical protein